jgi:hypothetical protein
MTYTEINRLLKRAHKLDTKARWSQEDLDFALYLHALYLIEEEKGTNQHHNLLRFYPYANYDTNNHRNDYVPKDLSGLSFRGHDLRQAQLKLCHYARCDMCDVTAIPSGPFAIDMHTVKINQNSLMGIECL